MDASYCLFLFTESFCLSFLQVERGHGAGCGEERCVPVEVKNLPTCFHASGLELAHRNG